MLSSLISIAIGEDGMGYSAVVVGRTARDRSITIIIIHGYNYRDCIRRTYKRQDRGCKIHFMMHQAFDAYRDQMKRSPSLNP